MAHEATGLPTKGMKEMSIEPERDNVEDTQDASGRDRPKPEKIYVIQVNTQDVKMQQRKATGAEIKAAAIAQGVTIEPGFVLSVQHGDRYDIVGDDDEVTLHKGLDFIATAADDNS